VTPEPQTTTTTTPPANRPVRDTIVVDLGKKNKKSVKQLRKGKGRLMEEVNHVLNELKTAGAVTGTVQPVVIVVTEREDGSGIPFLNFLAGK
jgi:hypothetical protein